MSDFAHLATALAGLYTVTDNGSGAPDRVSEHEADRLATLPRHEHRPLRPIRRRRTLRRPA
ncbi:hypothetical protein [Kitasatospora sp. NPDC002040]|uniref:hypothetical protein n=1 Tax=Kitasatospora sp. NPDC002040 TaxID=3154661 RepID=UPI0033230360